MLFKLQETIYGYLRGRPYWSKIEPALTLLSLYVITLVLAYQYIEWQYRFSPDLSLYLKSYIVKQITVVFLGVGLLALCLSQSDKARENERPLMGRLWSFMRVAGRRIMLAIAVIALVASLFVYLSPHKVTNIRIKMLAEPRFDKYAFVYELYELNRLQKSWHFEVDVDPFDQSVLTSEQRKKCQGDNLCFAKMLAENDRNVGFIGITEDRLGQDSFWENNGTVSVVSTFGWDKYAPPSTYEYLAYSVLVQGILLHLNGQCSGLPESAYREGRVAYGDLFEFSPRRQEMRAEILAAHLSPRGEELLANCFGVEYMTECERLLNLDWLHSPRVKENLEKGFGVKM